MFVVEIYDPSTTNFKFVREVPLYKNEDFEPFIKNGNSIDFLRDSSFATNGQVLAVQTKTRVYFFDLKSGVRLQKVKTSENGANHDDCRMAYDFHNNLFYSFKHSTADTKLETFTLANFKKGGASSGFAKEHLQKRMKNFRAIVYGEEPIQTDGRGLQPHKLNLIQRIMKNVTTPVLISHSQIQDKSSNLKQGEEVVKYQRVIILMQIFKACTNFDLKLEEVASQKKSAAELEDHMMTFFKFPTATYLTHTVFQQIQENLDRTTYLIDSKKTRDNLADQYALYIMLKILTANFKALSFCSIALPDLMDEESYHRFL
jgi:hypothetical protein